MKLISSLASTTARSVSIFIIGVGCFGLFAYLTSNAVTETLTREPEVTVVVTPRPSPTPKPTRYVPPAEIQLPIY